MRRISSFTFTTLNGFFKGPGEDTSWHQHGEEGARFSEESMQSGNILLFGRKTYEMMYSFWPSPMAAEYFPKVAVGMNKAEKIVFSRTLTEAKWENTRLYQSNLIDTIRDLKQQPGNNITILGSGSLITQLSDAGLIDDYAVLIDPLAIGEGTPLLHGIQKPLQLKHTATRVFEKSGMVLLSYTRS